MNEAVKFLKSTNKYDRLIAKWEETKNLDFGFEILFCYQCESSSLYLHHEVSANEENEKTVDFSTNIDGVDINFELVRIGLNKGIRELKRADDLKGYVLNSDDIDPNLRTGAQIIKLQWGLLEKVEKFAAVNKSTINIVCVDCSNVHAGMLDEHDVAITMWGKPYNPIWIEKWEGERIQGLLESEYSQRGSGSFKEKVSAVIFISKLKYQPLSPAYIALNNLLGSEHNQLIVNSLKKRYVFGDLEICPCN